MTENLRHGSRWKCLYCGTDQVLQTNSNFTIHMKEILHVTGHYKGRAYRVLAITCINSKCNQFIMHVELLENDSSGMVGVYPAIPVKSWRLPLNPISIAKPQPNCIPKYIRIEYEKACKIVHDDPGASVVRSRRCIEGMLKDFCNIEENNLAKAIDKLKAKVRENKIPEVTEESIEEIDTIRKMGKIGAHIMKAGGDTIVEVSQGDAERVIKIIEYLFKDWYVARHNREKNQKDREQNSKGLQASLEKYNKKTANQKKDRKSKKRPQIKKHK